ncbi:hypothetical protein LEP1GSC163_0915 [Leptospira santarosai str. CBC379]|uniref:Uncharacterized protein n=1 Tax=Leptospira santarosai str. MOR084 TaxID=1049984 RepID=A0A0E2BBR3_9LEPT|nr:hypothetical protein [Leptospira santarosai]EKO32779.1 hypothetical protein LEP1GSC179_3024 [Leptospira santarosai str. MOR084]EKR92932.1 hypothetical protein LEP1GSC163_0915 [Leptospira santarosai str. CBC379]
MINHFFIQTGPANKTAQIALSETEKEIVSRIAYHVRELFTTFDWRWNDHREMTDKEIAAIFLVRNDVVHICGKDPKLIREFMSILEYILDEEFGE